MKNTDDLFGDLVEFGTDHEGSNVGHRTVAEAVELAEKEGLRAFFPLPNEVFLDIDQPTMPVERWNVMSTLKQAADDGEFSYEIISTLYTRSKSGNFHVYYRLAQPVDDSVRLLLQALLGSDPVKEACAWLRLCQNSEAPICLFETADGAKRVDAWREGVPDGTE